MPINAAAFRKRVSAGISDALELLDEARFISLSTFTFTLVLWRISYYTVDALLNTKDGEEKDKLIILWRENKIQELNVIFISGSLIAGVISAAFSWPTTAAAPWTTLSLWYSGLFLAFISISIAAWFSLALLRLSGYPNCNEFICKMLGYADQNRYGDENVVKWRPRQLQLYIWQLPRMLLTASIFEFAIGLCLMIWDMAFARGFEPGSNEAKILIAFMVIGGFACINGVVSVCLLFRATSELKMH